MFAWAEDDEQKDKSPSFFSCEKFQNYRRKVFIFTPLQIADVKASCCHRGMPESFIVIAGLFSCFPTLQLCQGTKNICQSPGVCALNICKNFFLWHILKPLNQKGNIKPSYINIRYYY